MIQISPAILESDLSEFRRQLNIYSTFANQIDIDLNIQGDDFVGKETLSPETVINELLQTKLTNLFGLHLMLSTPMHVVERFSKSLRKFRLIFYVHQESDIAFTSKLSMSENHRLGLAIKAESPLYEVNRYLQFEEIQLMTIETGGQGNPFKPEVLKRAEWLRESGYKGKISIDGGVNLDTAEIIKKYPIDRVSVGSYFSKSSNPAEEYEKLNKELNG